MKYKVSIWDLIYFVLCGIGIGICICGLMSCTSSYNKDNTGREYYETTTCIKSHEEKEYGYHWGYNYLSGKFGFHWGYQCFYAHTKTVCDSSVTKRIYK